MWHGTHQHSPVIVWWHGRCQAAVSSVICWPNHRPLNCHFGRTPNIECKSHAKIRWVKILCAILSFIYINLRSLKCNYIYLHYFICFICTCVYKEIRLTKSPQFIHGKSIKFFSICNICHNWKIEFVLFVRAIILLCLRAILIELHCNGGGGGVFLFAAPQSHERFFRYLKIRNNGCRWINGNALFFHICLFYSRL